ncbi:MAG TPA: phage major capsid protein [Solirubrobacteraceae bacterium]|jgi:hypothetical protein|nr:phage major capsid protein [Solirubrobacteraceae bacterium]
MTISTTQRDRLNQIRERANSARGRRAAAQKALDAAKAAQDPQAQHAAEVAYQHAVGEVDVARELEAVLLSQAAGVSSGAMFGTESFLDDPETVASLEQLAHSSMPIGQLNLGPLASREDLIGMLESGSWGPSRRSLALTEPALPDMTRQTAFYGTVPQLRRRLRLLDLIPTMAMDGLQFAYAQESGSLDTAEETPEGSLKPQGDQVLTDALVIAKTIAHWFKLKRQQLADVPALGTVVNNRLTYGVMRRVENQIVSGDGEGDDLLGILNTAGIATVAFDGSVPLSDLSLDGIVDVLTAEAQPNAVVLNPTDWAAMLKVKSVGSGDRLDSAGAFSTPADQLWGLPAIPSTVMPTGQALVGDFTAGCTLFVREGVNVRISDADQDDFLRNQLTMLGEGRFGLAIWQPAAFALVNLAA